MLTISSGHSADYLTGAVATGRENYYTGAVAAGEPPGRWFGRGAESLGLWGEVESQDMTALYEHYVDPRDERFGDPIQWAEPDTLGHAGRKYKSEDEIYAAALAAEPGADAERRDALRVEAGKKARKNVSFLDATFSVQKSVTVLHTAFEAQAVRARGAAEQARSALEEAHRCGDTGAVHQRTDEVHRAEAEAAAWDEHRQAVEDAIWAGNQQSLEYLADKAGYARVGHHGGAAGRWVDAHDWTVASFFQHDSRDHDPQLHIHNAILNRVEGADGQWRTVDSRAIHKYRGAAAAVGERVMEEHLRCALGVEFATRPDGKAREIVGIDQPVMDLFSSRRRAITTKTARLVEAFEAKYGREPNSLERDRLQRSATFATRNVKSHEGENFDQRLERWDTELRAEIRGGLEKVAADVLDRRQQVGKPHSWSAREVIETALADVQETKSGWTRGDLTRAVSDALPDHLGAADAADVARLLDGLTDEALKLAVPLESSRPGDEVLPDSLRLANGASAYQAPGATLYATPAHIHTERLLSAATVDRGAPAMPTTSVERYLSGLGESGIELGADQVAAVRGVLTSGASVETLVGPAGTGKSFVVGTLARAWEDAQLWGGDHRRVVGLAASQIATEVLADEGLAAQNITRWLATHDRLDAGSTDAGDRAWQLSAGDLVVVDESAMADTAALARIHERCHERGAKLLLTGDHRQLAAVGAGGAMDLVAATGVRHELAETRRFHGTWEGPASLRLRDGDEGVLGEYHKHGRILDGGVIEQTESAAARAWLADILDGQQSLLIVDTNEQAARLSAHLRADLVRLGKVDEPGVELGLQGTVAGAGDLVQARRNGWDLAGHDGNRRGPINREQYRVLETRDDGGLTVATIAGRTAGGEILGERMSLPGSYVAEHMTLGYASTVHAAQGLTVDTAHTVATGQTGADALYVGLTRGRHINTAHVVTQAPPVADAATGETHDAVHRDARGVLAGAFETADPQRSATTEAAENAAETRAIKTPGELFTDAAEQATAERAGRWLDRLTTDGILTEEQREQMAAENGATTLTTLLRRVEIAGHDAESVLRDAVCERELNDARQITNVIHRRITHTTDLTPTGNSYVDWVPIVDDPQMTAYLTRLAEVADDRRTELGAQAADETPPWALEALGAPPDDHAERAHWQHAAGVVAAHRELTGHDDPDEPLGRAPKPGQVEGYASWRAAWAALGRPEADRAEAEMSDGQLHMRVRAYEREKTWAPAYVANELAGTRQTADRHRQDATLRATEADNAVDHTARADLLTRADEAAALADELDARADELAAADDARARWYAHTAETRAAADRAQAELSTRQLGAEPADAEVTAQQWLAAHDEAVRAEDSHRLIDRLAEVDHENDVVVDDEALPDTAADPEASDLRTTAGEEERPVEDDSVRVPTAEETAASITRAQRALHEIQYREYAEHAREVDEARDDDLARWHADDHTQRTTEIRSNGRPVGDEPVLERSGPTGL